MHDEGFLAQTHIFQLRHPMVVICIFGLVPFGAGFQGKEGHPFLENSGVPSKNANPYLLCILCMYMFMCAYH